MLAVRNEGNTLEEKEFSNKNASWSDMSLFKNSRILVRLKEEIMLKTLVPSTGVPKNDFIFRDGSELQYFFLENLMKI